MCRSIVTLHRSEAPATDDEVRAAALQFVRKISGYRAPSRANSEAFETAVDEVAAATSRLLDTLAPRRMTAVSGGGRATDPRRSDGLRRAPDPRRATTS